MLLQKSNTPYIPIKKKKIHPTWGIPTKKIDQEPTATNRTSFNNQVNLSTSWPPKPKRLEFQKWLKLNCYYILVCIIVTVSFFFFFCCTKWIIMPMNWLKSSSQAVENQPIFSGRPLVPFLLMVNSVLYTLHIPLMQLITKPQQNRQV